MKHIKRLLFFILVLCCLAATGQAQVDTAGDGGYRQGGVTLHADPRLAIVLKKQKSTQYGVIYSGKGYRVQIYSGNDRKKAIASKIDFIRHFPGVPTYMTYLSPQYRVKVGDYRTRAEAEKMYQLASDLYHPSMIVPDFIVINTLSE